MAALLKSNTYKLVTATFKSYVYSYKQNFQLKIRLRWYRRSDWLKNEHSNYLGLKEASVFLKMGQTQPLFVLFIFVLFLWQILHKFDFNWLKSVDDVLGIWSKGGRMVGKDESTEL